MQDMSAHARRTLGADAADAGLPWPGPSIPATLHAPVHCHTGRENLK